MSYRAALLLLPAIVAATPATAFAQSENPTWHFGARIRETESGLIGRTDLAVGNRIRGSISFYGVPRWTLGGPPGNWRYEGAGRLRMEVPDPEWPGCIPVLGGGPPVSRVDSEGTVTLDIWDAELADLRGDYFQLDFVPTPGRVLGGNLVAGDLRLSASGDESSDPLAVVPVAADEVVAIPDLRKFEERSIGVDIRVDPPDHFFASWGWLRHLGTRPAPVQPFYHCTLRGLTLGLWGFWER